MITVDHGRGPKTNSIWLCHNGFTITSRRNSVTGKQVLARRVVTWHVVSFQNVVPSYCNEAPHHGPSGALYLSLALDPRELLVAVFGGIAQSRFRQTHDAPPV